MLTMVLVASPVPPLFTCVILVWHSCLGLIDLREVSDGTISCRRERNPRRENGHTQPLIGGSGPLARDPRISGCVWMARGKLGTGYPRLLGSGCSREGSQR